MSQETDRQLVDLYIKTIKTINKHRLTFDSIHNENGECYYCDLSSTGIAEHLAEELLKGVEEVIRKAQEQAWAEGAVIAWRESGIRTYGNEYAELPDNGFVPFSVAVKNPYRSQE